MKYLHFVVYFDRGNTSRESVFLAYAKWSKGIKGYIKKNDISRLKSLLLKNHFYQYEIQENISDEKILFISEGEQPDL